MKMPLYFHTKCATAAIALCILLLMTVTIASAEDIYICNCSSLDTDGATYYLTQDINDSHTSECMNISANNVTLDCQHHTIDGDDSASYGIFIRRLVGQTTNITIKNCVLSDWSSANIYLFNVHGNEIENVTSTSCQGTSIAIRLQYSDFNIITNATVIDNQYYGIYLVNSDSNIITDSTINSNEVGIYLWSSGSNVINNSRIETNSEWGYCSAGSGNANKIYNNLFNNFVNYNLYGEVEYWNITRQAGIRIFPGGTEIGGNYWTNASGTGYSDTCIDADNDGFCDNPHILTGTNIDYLPLSDECILPDIIPGDIEVKHNYCIAAWAELNNTVDVTVQNNGIGDTGSFNVKLYAKTNEDYEEIDSKIVSELLAGDSTTVSFIWKPIDSEVYYDLKVVTDPDNAINESNETNNETTKQQYVKYNGYMGDKPLTTYAQGKIKGNLFFTHGDSHYSGKKYPGMTYTVHHTVDIPNGATVKFARLYSYWTWSPEVYPDMNLTFDGNPVNLDIEYTDRKGWGGSYDYPAGTYAYNVTSFIDGSGDHTTVITNIGSEYFCMNGLGLLVVYTDLNGTDMEYWINEGADMLSTMDTSGGLMPDEATTTALFSGSVDMDNVSYAWLWTVVQSGGHEGNMLLFNNYNWTGVYDATPYPDLDIDEKRDVTNYLQLHDNIGKIRGAPYSEDGDYLMPSNAFLVIEYGTDISSPHVTDYSPTGDDVPVILPITVTFNETMNQTSVEEAFSIVPGAAGTFEWVINTMTYTPGENLSYNTAYNITIDIGAKDRAGNNLESLHNWEFTTQDVEDITPPNVTSHSPTGVDIPIQTEILITFSETMDHSSTQNAFSIVPYATGTFTWDGNNMTFSPYSLDYNTTYSVSIASSAIDLSGNTLDGNDNGVSEGSPADDYTWQFTTEQQEFISWDYDGFPLTTKSHGTVNGGMFISYGDNDKMENAKVKPYISNYSIPNGTPVWAKLYMHLWGGNPNNGGTVNVTFNNHEFETVVIEGKQTNDPHVLGAGCGTWWIFFNVTDHIDPGDTNMAQASVTSISMDGRIARMVLVEAYEGGDDPHNIMYWVNDGHMNLHYNSTEYPWCLDYAKTWFNGTVPSGVTEANLTGIWLTGSYGEPDYFYFSPPDETDAPNGENLNWDINNYTDYQFGSYDQLTGNMSYNDVAMGGGYYNNYFDIHSNTTTNTSSLINNLKDDNNYAIFWRGHDDNDDDWISGAFGGPGDYEGEGYVHAVLAALVLNLEEEDITPPYTDGHDPAPGAVNVAVDADITVHVKDSGVGVNESSIVMKVNGVSITPGITGTPADLELVCDPWVDFENEETVNVSIDACDLNDNCMQYTWEFTTQQQSQPGVCGDVTNDTNVNIGDVILIANHAGYPDDPRYEVDEWAADVNSNGGVNIGDVILLANHVGYPDDPRYSLNCTGD